MLLSRKPLLAVLALCLAPLLYYSWALKGIRIGTQGLTSYVPPESHEAPEGIPKILWYKLGPNGLNENTTNWTNSFIAANPGYEVNFLTDETADEFVKNAFASARPDIVEAFLGLTVPILKADMLRYILLYDQGGIWNDLDVSCEIPVDEWIPPQYQNATLVVGWEFDVGWGDNFLRQFASWTIMAKPRSPHMMQVIDDMMDSLHAKMEKHNVTVEDITLYLTGDVVDFSGPRRLTFGVLKSLKKQLNRTVVLNDYKEIVQPQLVGDVLIMPGRSFASSSNTYSPEQESQQISPVLVTHHYAGSWKNEHGGEQP